MRVLRSVVRHNAYMPALQPDVRSLIVARRWCQSGRARELQNRAGLVDADVGRATGVTPRTAQAWANGEQVPRRAHAIAYGEFLLALARELGEPEVEL